MTKQKYGKSPAMADLPKVKADNKKALVKLKKNGVSQPMAARDKRTKAELIKLLEATRAQRDIAMKHIKRDPNDFVPACDTPQFQEGYRAGVKAQQVFEKKHFFTFWRYW